jgi:aspartyl-tRNA(Asn)/glutamyl-tRNA(Gln) amidotransferase subunit A
MSVSTLGAAEIASRTARRELSVIETTRDALERIERRNPELNAFVEVFRDEAIESAGRADREAAAGRPCGPLHGVPIAIKDIFDVEGHANAAGSVLRRERIAARDAHVVSRLRAAGAILLGRLNLHELAFGITTNNPHFGPTRNPWRLDRVPGGSSGGSGAALAAGLCALSMGTDTGGSIRIPAAACGVVGLKPTFGRVSRRGVVPLAWSLDHVGPMARSVEDAMLMLAVIAAPDPADPWCAKAAPQAHETFDAKLEEMRLGVPRSAFFKDLDADVERAVEQAIATLASLGARVIEIDLPHAVHAYTAFHTMLASEAAAYHRTTLETHPDDLGDDVRRGLELGGLIRAVDYVDARRMQQLVRDDFDAAFAAVDVIVTPMLPHSAPAIGTAMSREPREAWNRLAPAFNLAGVPAMSLPCGFDRDGLPLGLQLAARWWDEATLARAGSAYQRKTDWHERMPAES